MIEVIRSGLMSSIQDLGRESLMHMGVSRSGALDPLAMKIANRLVENPLNAAVLEIIMPPAEFYFHQNGWFALTGAACKAMLDSTPVWLGWRVPVKKGQRLILGPAKAGMSTYLAVAGGFDVPLLMSSAATDIKAGFGGHHPQGLTLKAGDKLKIGQPTNVITQIIGVRLPHWDNSLRVIPGPEYEQFSVRAQRKFWHSNWRIDSSSNRMGFRLQGDTLERMITKDILSQGVFAGVIQVPPNGQPIILAAEAQSAGGYPRIGIIIQADLWKLGQSRIGHYLRFISTTSEKARNALIEQKTYLDKIDYIITEETHND